MSEYTIKPARVGEIPEILKLADQDLVAGKFIRPDQVKNPYDFDRIESVARNIRKSPGSYHTATIGTDVVGYIRTGLFTYGNQEGFLSPIESVASKGLQALKLGNFATRKQGFIIGLVTEDLNDDALRGEIANSLLDVADEQAEQAKLNSISVPLHDYDPLTPTFENHGYKPVERFGKIVTGRASGVEGVDSIVQTLYRLNIK